MNFVGIDYTFERYIRLVIAHRLPIEEHYEIYVLPKIQSFNRIKNGMIFLRPIYVVHQTIIFTKCVSDPYVV